MAEGGRTGLDRRETVVLLHGIERTGRSMAPLGRALAAAGYATAAPTYPSRRLAIDAAADWLAAGPLAAGALAGAGRVHLVGHSMGGLVALRWLARHAGWLAAAHRLGRLVMLGPPVGGSEVADFLCRNPLYRAFYGPAGDELTTAARAEPPAAPPCEVGVVAGTVDWPYPDARFLVPGPSDGRVAVAGTRLPGMADHATAPVAHGFYMRSRTVQRLVIGFLKDGRFPPGAG